MKKIPCRVCHKTPLSKNEIGINKKLIDPDTSEFFCISCLSNYLECSIDDINDKIEEFKEQGCTLFS